MNCMAKNNTVTNIESYIKVNNFLTFNSVICLILYLTIAYMFKDNVHRALFIPYMIFSGCCCLFLIIPSKYNKGRNHLESIFLLFKSDKNVYRPFISGGGNNDEEQVP